MWETPYGNAVLKIKRANKHIADIEQRLLAARNAYQLTLHVDAKSGKQFLNYRISDRKIRAHLALMIGDAIHNLKCALDIAWGNTYTTLYPTTFEPRFLNFPFQPERKTLETVLTKKGKIPDTCRLFSFVVDSVKSYKTGNPDLWAVHRLDIHDKHRLLIVVLNFMFIDDVELEHENGEVECRTLTLAGLSSGRIEIPFGSHLKSHGQAAIEVKFCDGMAAEGLSVVPTLQGYSRKVSRIVRTLRKIK